MSSKKISRRELLKMSAAAAAGLLLTACQPKKVDPVEDDMPVGDDPTAVPAATDVPVNANILGKVYPADALPAEEQILTTFGGTMRTMDRFVSMYQGADFAGSLSLVRFNDEYDVLPCAAESWEISDDGTKWTFHLVKGIMWTDGQPLTADDFVASFQYGALPEHAWDFAWYYNNILNWKEATAGEVGVEELGVRAIDDYTLEFETTSPAPFLPGQLLWSAVLNKAALEAHGEYYNNDPATTVSCSPYKLVTYEKDVEVVYEMNPDYTGPAELIPYYTKIRSYQPPAIDNLTAYQSSEVTTIGLEADLARVAEEDPELSEQLYWTYGDFRCFFISFNFEAPFDDPRVRMAIAKSFNRDILVPAAAGNAGVGTYTFLGSGFPGSHADTPEGQAIQSYDPEAARQLLVDAGYPNGEGLPKLEIPVRPGVAALSILAQGIAEELGTELGIEAEIVNWETKVFIDETRATRSVPMYMDGYGMDYLDQSNMLGIFITDALINWNDAQYDDLISEAGPFLGAKAERDELFWAAEKRLLEEAGIIPLYTIRSPSLVKPNVAGAGMEPDKAGSAGPHWPTSYPLGAFSITTYLTKG
jgi:ABC-type transport system substrate-binding protein